MEIGHVSSSLQGGLTDRPPCKLEGICPISISEENYSILDCAWLVYCSIQELTGVADVPADTRVPSSTKSTQMTVDIMITVAS